MRQRSARRRPPVAAVGCILGAMTSVALGTSVAKRLFPTVGAQGTTAYRVGFSAVILLAAWRPWRRAVTPRDGVTLGLYGASLGTMNLLFYLALRTVPFGPAVALEFLGPMAVATVASRRAIDFVWVAMAAGGLSVLLPVHGHGPLDGVGAAYAMGAGACWAAYIVFGHRAGAAHGPGATAMGMAVAAGVVVPIGVVHAGAALLDARLAAVGLTVAVLSGVVPFSLEMVALRRLPKRTFSVLVSVEPVLAAASAWAVNGERLTASQVTAMAVITAAAAGAAATARATPTAADDLAAAAA